MLHVLAQANSNGGDSLGALIVLVVYLAIIVAVVAGMWKMFAKAGQPGWAAIVPIYNLFILLKIVGRPWWWLILMFIPVVSIVVAIVVFVDLGKSFGKGTLFILGLVFLGFIFIPVLGFGDSQYQGPAGAGKAFL